MLNKVLLLCNILIFGCIFNSCKNEDPKENPDIIGSFTWNEWQEKSGWADHSASDYMPDSVCLVELKTLIDAGFNPNLEIYASNWCYKDCATQLPKIIKFLKASGISENSIIIYGLNRTKTEPVDAMGKWSIAFPNENCYVPTLVIYMDNEIRGKVKCEASDFPLWQCEIPLLIGN